MEKVIYPPVCDQCGDLCFENDVLDNGLHFCCSGCKTAYKLIHSLNVEPKMSTENVGNSDNKYAFLDDTDIQMRLISVRKEGCYTIEFLVPSMHCASCVYVLEHLDKLDQGVLYAQVNFGRKTVVITYDNNKTSLRGIVELMDGVGYAPELNRSLLKNKKVYKVDRGLILRIAVAGFCFGNIMMLSFPEYLAGRGVVSPEIKSTFMWLSLVLSLPVVFYSADSYFLKSWQALKARVFDIDLPIALSMAVTFFRGIYEVVLEHSAGYFDSLAGLIFFLLVGKWFQQRTFNFMAFERENEAYMPLSATRMENGVEHCIPVMKLVPDDIVRIKSREIIPADGMLISEYAVLDYSFVTGESTPVYKKKGEVVHAGSINAEISFDINVLTIPDQSYLLTLWNADIHDKGTNNAKAYQWVHNTGRYFTYLTLLVALCGAAWWALQHNTHMAVTVFTSVLIVACPCVLAIALPFTQGHVLRLLGRHGFYLKSAQVIERMRRSNVIVFDKTGTITEKTGHIQFSGTALTEYELQLVKTLTFQSMHPLSRRIAAQLSAMPLLIHIEHFKEVAGKGVSAMVDGHAVKVGSAAWAGVNIPTPGVHVAIDKMYKGCYCIEDAQREGIGMMLNNIKHDFDMYLVTGDNGTHRQAYNTYFEESHIYFNAKPEEKMYLIEGLQTEGKNVLMVGDGLNDAAALKTADTGIAVFDKASTFIPACDAMLDAQRLKHLPSFLRFARASRVIVLAVFGFALIYNAGAVVFALQGRLTPIIAAILMPLSSITIVTLTTISTYLLSKKLLPK